MWEFVEDRLIATSENKVKDLPPRLDRFHTREVVVGKVDLDMACDYVVIPYTKKRGMEMNFTMRIFSINATKIEQAAKPFFVSESGSQMLGKRA